MKPIRGFDKCLDFHGHVTWGVLVKCHQTALTLTNEYVTSSYDLRTINDLLFNMFNLHIILQWLFSLTYLALEIKKRILYIPVLLPFQSFYVYLNTSLFVSLEKWYM